MKYKFSEATDMAKCIFIDLNAKALRFNYRTLPDKKQMIFTAVEDADTVKAIFSKFEIREDSRKRRYAELVIGYE